MRFRALPFFVLVSLGVARCARPNVALTTPIASTSALDPDTALQGVVCEQPELEDVVVSPRAEPVREAEHALDETAMAHRQIQQLRARALHLSGNNRSDHVVRCLGDKLVEARATLCFVRAHRSLLRDAVRAEDPTRTRYEQSLLRIGRSRAEALLSTVDLCAGAPTE